MANRLKMSPHSRAALMASDDMKKVIDSFTDAPFMDEAVAERTRKRQELLSRAAPDIAAQMAQGLPAYLAEKLVRMDEDAAH